MTSSNKNRNNREKNVKILESILLIAFVLFAIFIVTDTNKNTPDIVEAPVIQEKSAEDIREEKVNEAKALEEKNNKELEYLDKRDELIKRFIEVNDLTGQTMKIVEEDPGSMFTNEYRDTTNKVFDLADKIHEDAERVKVPEKFKKSHDKLVKSAEFYSLARKDYIDSSYLKDLQLLEEANKKIRISTNLMEESNNLIEK